MTREEAVMRARTLADVRGWTWRDPVIARWGRRWFVGAGRWTVVSNARSRGCSVRVVFDDTTGEVVEAGFLPR